MKKYIIAFLIAITSITFAQALVEQFYTLKPVNKGTRLTKDDAANIAGYLAPEFNQACGACDPTTDTNCPAIGGQVCAVMRAKVQPKALGMAVDYYRIIQANHGTEIANFVGWMEDNKACGLPVNASTLMGTKGCALIHASPYGSDVETTETEITETEY